MDALKNIEDLETSEVIFPFDTEESDGKHVIRPVGTNLPASQQFKERNKLSDKQKAREEKCLKIHKEEFEVRGLCDSVSFVCLHYVNKVSYGSRLPLIKLKNDQRFSKFICCSNACIAFGVSSS